MAATTLPGGGGQPVQVLIDREQSINRLWGIPLFGLLARWLLLIPHFLILWALGVVVALSVFVSWIPILFIGRLPDSFVDLYVLTYRWTVRVGAYAVLMVEPYPPFSSTAPYPVDIAVVSGRSISRLWGIPFLGAWVRSILIIPHAIVLIILSFGIFFATLVTWIPVLINGRFPQLGYDLFGGYMRLSTRATLWTLFLAIPYPPISPSE